MNLENSFSKKEDSPPGIITDIQKFSVHDGPGIRTVVFMKGCPLRCAWCQNPETQFHQPEIAYFSSSCVQCGSCLRACPERALSVQDDGKIIRDPELCKKCGKCVTACNFNAMRMFGKYSTADDVIHEVLKDRVFYEQSGGGVTLSGGEPLLQHDFSLYILKQLNHEGIHTAIETCGYCQWEDFLPILNHTDLVLFDLKHLDFELHKNYTGVNNDLILNNLKNILQMEKKIVVRFPLIPGFNDDTKNIDAMVAFLKNNRLSHLHIMPFHQMGQEKWYSLKKNYACETVIPPSEETITKIVKQMRSAGIIVNVGGDGNYPD